MDEHLTTTSENKYSFFFIFRHFKFKILPWNRKRKQGFIQLAGRQTE